MGSCHYLFMSTPASVDSCVHVTTFHVTITSEADSCCHVTILPVRPITCVHFTIIHVTITSETESCVHETEFMRSCYVFMSLLPVRPIHVAMSLLPVRPSHAFTSLLVHVTITSEADSYTCHYFMRDENHAIFITCLSSHPMYHRYEKRNATI